MVMSVLRAVMWLVIGLGLAIAAIWVVGPREEVDTAIAFDPSSVPADLDGWLADRENGVADLNPDHAKFIRWARAPGQRTETSIVYVHGFSATPWEIRPVPERVAEEMGANIFFTRLSGHGRNGDAMAEPTAGDWLEDIAEAMEVGRRLGDEVIVIATSTGATLAAILAADPALAAQREDLSALIFVAPNFRVANPSAGLLSLPAARWWVPLVAGERRSFEPQNVRHGRHWTTEYPTVALLPMQAAIDYAASLDYGATDLPVLFYFSDADQVVDATATRDIAARWGGPVAVEAITTGPGDDPYSHVIAGDILSPGQTPAAIDRMVTFLRGL